MVKVDTKYNYIKLIHRNILTLQQQTAHHAKTIRVTHIILQAIPTFCVKNVKFHFPAYMEKVVLICVLCNIKQLNLASEYVYITIRNNLWTFITIKS